jgi:atypical dual specificity phosphatase
MSPITIYGEWMNFSHSIFYDQLPDLFIAYDIWSVEDNKFLSPDKVEELLSKTSIRYIKPRKMILNSISDIISLSEMKSDYRDGLAEGIVVKTSENGFLKDTWKVVNKYFERRDDFNTCLIKNKIVSL